MPNQTLMHILIVDDSILNHRVVAEALKENNYKLTFASHGKHALMLAFNNHYDLILLDIMMPEMDGFEVCIKLKSNPKTLNIPIIFLTGKIDKKSIVKAFASGSVDYITKPFNISELQARVDTHLKLQASIKQLNKANLDLRRSQGRLQSFLQNIEDLVCFRNLHGNPALVNPAYTRLTGITTTRLRIDNQCWRNLVFPTDLKKMDDFFQQHPQGFERYDIEYRIKNTQGKLSWLHTRMVGIPNGKNQYNGYHCIERDITQQKKIEAQKLHHMTLMLDNAHEAMMITDTSGKIISVNPAFCEMMQYQEHEIIAKHHQILHSDKHAPDFYQKINAEINCHGHWEGEVWVKTKPNKAIPTRQSIIPETNQQGKNYRYIYIFSDITKEKLSQERIHQLAFYDPLTSLPNRKLFEQRLSTTLIHNIDHQNEGSLLYLGLDRFKTMNESLGYSVSDGLLKEAASRIEQLTGKRENIARIGSDEFSIILQSPHINEDTSRLAHALLSSFRQPFELFGNMIVITISIGICYIPHDGQDVDTLLKNAKTAMQRAKTLGRDNFQSYSTDLAGTALDELMLESQLRKAIPRHELHMFFQPKIDLQTNKVIGAEALIRWIRPDNSFISPATFIPIAEKSGQIYEIGEWVLLTTCQVIRELEKKHAITGRIAVNLSAIQFQKGDIVALIEKTIKQTGIQGKHLELEITESVILRDPQEVIKILTQLKRLNIQISLDDFGTGFSSLSYLKQLPVDTIKIDKSFISDLENSKGDQAIVQTIIALGKNLGLQTIAEGVETNAQVEFLKHNGCDQAQGYLYAKPMPAGLLTSL